MTSTIVVGVSGRSGSSSALAWAVDEAVRRDASVVAVRAWRPSAPSPTGWRPPLHTPHDAASGVRRLTPTRLPHQG